MVSSTIYFCKYSGKFIYMCDFAKTGPLSFRLNTGIGRVHASVSPGPDLSVGGFLVLNENQGGREGRFCHFRVRVLCQKVVHSQRIFPVASWPAKSMR